MITIRDLATLRAALLFWQEEMCPNDNDFMRPYFDSPEIEPLTIEEVNHVRDQLQAIRMRYALYVTADRRLALTRLYPTHAAAQEACNPPEVPVPVLIPEE